MLQRLLIATFTLFLLGCQATTPPTKPLPNTPVSPVQDMLDKHLTQWKQANIHNYTYEFQRSCFCMRDFTKPVLTRVENNTVVDARFKDNNKPLPDNFKTNRQTINMLFSTIQGAIDRKAHSIEVHYDEKYGYPTSISVDYDQRMADEEVYLKASNFKR